MYIIRWNEKYNCYIRNFKLIMLGWNNYKINCRRIYFWSMIRDLSIWNVFNNCWTFILCLFVWNLWFYLLSRINICKNIFKNNVEIDVNFPLIFVQYLFLFVRSFFFLFLLFFFSFLHFSSHRVRRVKFAISFSLTNWIELKRLITLLNQ